MSRSWSGLPPVASRFDHPLGPQVHDILWREWDPLAVNDVAPNDEYDMYVRPLIDILLDGGTIEKLADYLDWIAGERMGLGVNRSASLAIAGKLLTLRPVEDAT